jgi:anti-sigma regulatory factor (Ser/Thr protein kinase)
VDEHAVHYYEDDDAFVAFVGAHLTAGVEAGEHVIAIASGAHLTQLERLVSARLDDSSVGSRGRLVLLEARETLDLFMVDGSPDPFLFRTHVGRLITEAAHDGSPVRAFGEMVALLWDDGNVAGAIELESLWNHLLAHQRFTLLCGYPTTALAGVSLRDVQAVCDLHSAVLPPPSYGSTTLDDSADDHSDMRSEVFVPVAQAVRATRRFVFGVLDAWGLADLQWDAALIVSELANNAVRHGASPFRVLVSRAGDGVRIGIHDVAPGRPHQRPAAEDDLDGRGIAIVKALSTGWGCESLSDGKFTWADLAAAPSA